MGATGAALAGLGVTAGNSMVFWPIGTCDRLTDMVQNRPRMKPSQCALGLFLLGAALLPVLSSAQSPKLVVTEGHYIGYVSVADALATLQAKGLTPKPGLDGVLSFVEPDNGTAWTFAGKDDPAYPSVVRYVYTRRPGVLQAEVTILCEASAGPCEKFRSGIRDKLAELAKMMAGDPSAKCSVHDGTVKCDAESGPKKD